MSVRKRLCTALTLAAVAALASCTLVAPPKPARALPIFTRRYGTPCQTCHTIPPKLNKTGLAFQANHLNWPNNHPPAYHDGVSAAPISGLITSGHFEGQNQETLTAFQAMELFGADGFTLTPGKKGGYWVDLFAATNDNQRASDLDGAWVALPVAGSNGQFAVQAGQFAPLTYQWDGISNLSISEPAPLDTGADGISFDSAQPGVRFEYFDNRGKLTANGNYVELGVPFDGHLTFNKESMVDGPHGAYLHAFKRVGFTTAGVLYYHHDNSDFGSLIGTRHIGHYVYLLGSAAVGQDANGTERYLSGQADVCPYPWLAFTGRYESIMGTASDAYPVFAVTYYPGKQYWLRFTAETVQQRANRSNSVFAFVQF